MKQQELQTIINHSDTVLKNLLPLMNEALKNKDKQTYNLLSRTYDIVYITWEQSSLELLFLGGTEKCVNGVTIPDDIL